MYEQTGGDMKRNDLIYACKEKLLQEREDLLSQQRLLQEQMSHQIERGGDEADQSLRAQDETANLQANDRLRFKIREIDLALHRIENGVYGVCEETEELIEKQRLLAIPWTRLSIEGAEIRELDLKRKKAVN